jgi:outer membrane biosynthesis protein TonB
VVERGRREIALVGSIAIHVAIFAVGIATCASSRDAPDRAPPTIQIVDIQMVAPPAVEHALDDVAGGGGGSPPAITQHAKPKPTKKPPRPRPARPIEPETLEPAPAAAPSTTTETTPIETTPATSANATPAASATGGSGGGIGGGTGTGRGTGSGTGVGTGSGTRTGTGTGLKPKPRVSRARPAKLRWPTRQREEVEDWVFVVMLTVDIDGDVVGAKLVKGHSFHENEKAMDAVWRFHYDPALDHDGRPIRSQVRQRFMIR